VQGGADRAGRNLGLLQAAAAREPADAYWQFQLGATYQQLRRPVEARRHLWQALESDGGTLTAEVRALAATRLAQLALAERRHGSAVAYATRALDAVPEGCISRVVLALALMYQRRFREALPHLEWLQINGRSQLSSSDDLDALAAACRQHAAPAP
jgi:tetratricopeptide (TPR) repeat protein